MRPLSVAFSGVKPVKAKYPRSFIPWESEPTVLPLYFTERFVFVILATILNFSPGRTGEPSPDSIVFQSPVERRAVTTL